MADDYGVLNDLQCNECFAANQNETRLDTMYLCLLYLIRRGYKDTSICRLINLYVCNTSISQSTSTVRLFRITLFLFPRSPG